MLAALVVGWTGLPAAAQTATPDLSALFRLTGVDPSRIPIEAPDAATMPMVDAHNHLNKDMTAESLIVAMDRAGVAAMVLMPRHYAAASEGGRATDELARDYAARFPGRFIPFVAGQRDNLGPQGEAWSEPRAARRIEAEFETKLSTGAYRGLGEFILVHHAYDVGRGELGGELNLPVDSGAMRSFASLAGRHRVPLLFHAEAEPDAARQAEGLVASSPETLFIWAHNCGRASAEDTARRLLRYPNLMCDLGHMFNGPMTQGGYGKGWPRKTEWVHLVQDDDGRLRPEMKALFERFPDRFIIGTDTAHTFYLRFYEYRIAIFRVMLSQISPEAARAIAAGNARRIFRIPSP